MADPSQVAVLLARSAIREELTAYLDAVMNHDWERVAQTFTPSARLDYGTPGVTGVQANIDLLEAGVDLLTSRSTLLGMHADIDVSGDSALSQATTFTAHTPAPGTDHRARMSIVIYEDGWFHDADDRWRITERVVHHRLRGWLDLV
jgi:ketosteroid isomerase-like protein